MNKSSKTATADMAAAGTNLRQMRLGEGTLSGVEIMGLAGEGDFGRIEAEAEAVAEAGGEGMLDGS